MNHGVVGTRYKENSKEWTKKKNGIYGWVTRTKTKYVCRFDGGAKSDVSKPEMMCQDRRVPKSNGGSPRLGLGEKTRLARGGDSDSVGSNLPGISGLEFEVTGSNMRESSEIMSERTDNG